MGAEELKAIAEPENHPSSTGGCAVVEALGGGAAAGFPGIDLRREAARAEGQILHFLDNNAVSLTPGQVSQSARMLMCDAGSAVLRSQTTPWPQHAPAAFQAELRAQGEALRAGSRDARLKLRKEKSRVGRQCHDATVKLDTLWKRRAMLAAVIKPRRPPSRPSQPFH